jgi:hypothetical protein
MWDYVEINLTDYPEKRTDMIAIADRTSVPQIFFNERHLGGASDVEALDESGLLDAMYADMVAAGDPSDPRLAKPDYPPKVDPALVVAEEEKFCIGGQLYSYSELMELFLRPKVKGGVDIDDRTYHLKKYPRCFVGEDFTTYLMKNFNVPNRADAIQAAKQLQVSRVFHHVVDEHGFEDKKLFYRFQVHEDMTLLNITKVWNGPALNAPMAVLNSLKKQLGAVVSAHSDSEGLVDYAAVNTDPKFKEFQANTAELQSFSLASMPVDMCKAFCINLYNMMVIHAYAQVGVPANSLQILRFFGKIAYRLGDFELTCNEIENGVLRGNRSPPTSPFKYFGKNDPRQSIVIEGGDHRIHFALNCGAKSCPAVKNYTAEAVNEELRIAAQGFCEEDSNVRIDVSQRRLYLSKILQWYGADFGDNHAEVARTILPYCRGQKKQDLETLLTGGKFKTVFNTYDWSNNAKTSPERKFGF